MPDLPTTLSIAALAISLISLIVSWYFGFRDRSKLIAISKFYPESQYGPASMTVKVVNVGRRLTLLRLLGGELDGGGWSGTYLDKVEGGLYLKENEFYEKTFHWDNLVSVGPEPDDDDLYKNLWFEDSRGHRHKVKGSKKNIRLLKVTK